MNVQKLISSLGIVLIILGISMLLPLFCSLYYQEGDWIAFLTSALITLLVGTAAYKFTSMEGDFFNREVYLLVTLCWVVASCFGALPYLFAGTMISFVDAFFEAMSGFTTTGSSVIPDLEALSHGMLFWRSLTHWLGGMGIIVLFVSIISSFGMGGLQIVRAEIPGHVINKIKPRISQTAMILWYTYLIFTVVLTLLLWAFGMSFFDAVCHAFGTVSTAGCSTKNANLLYYNNNLINWIIAIFMYISGVNFALYYPALKGRDFRIFWRSSEFRLYTYIILGAVLAITLSMWPRNPGEFLQAVSDSVFQVVAFTTTTGFVAADYTLWPAFSQTLLITLMLVGGCSGSTGGSIKVGRILIALKHALLVIKGILHPRAVQMVKVDDKNINAEAVANVLQFIIIFLLAVQMGTLALTALGFDLVSAFVAVVSALANVGMGFGQAGPSTHFGQIHDLAKMILAFLMLLGRLEFYTVLAVIIPVFYRNA